MDPAEPTLSGAHRTPSTAESSPTAAAPRAGTTPAVVVGRTVRGLPGSGSALTLRPTYFLRWARQPHLRHHRVATVVTLGCNVEQPNDYRHELLTCFTCFSGRKTLRNHVIPFAVCSSAPPTHIRPRFSLSRSCWASARLAHAGAPPPLPVELRALLQREVRLVGRGEAEVQTAKLEFIVRGAISIATHALKPRPDKYTSIYLQPLYDPNPYMIPTPI